LQFLKYFYRLLKSDTGQQSYKMGFVFIKIVRSFKTYRRQITAGQFLFSFFLFFWNFSAEIFLLFYDLTFLIFFNLLDQITCSEKIFELLIGFWFDLYFLFSLIMCLFQRFFSILVCFKLFQFAELLDLKIFEVYQLHQIHGLFRYLTRVSCFFLDFLSIFGFSEAFAIYLSFLKDVGLHFLVLFLNCL